MSKTKTKRVKVNRNAASDRWQAEIEPIVAEAHSRRGFVPEVCRQFERLAHRPIHRNTVDMWVHRDPKLRIEPGYGMGRLFMEAVTAARQAMDKKDDAKENGAD